MTLTESTDESKCCVSCRHNIRKKEEKYKMICCYCEKDGHYIGYTANFNEVCEEWEEENEG